MNMDMVIQVAMMQASPKQCKLRIVREFTVVRSEESFKVLYKNCIERNDCCAGEI
jgi:hypothetical protein